MGEEIEHDWPLNYYNYFTEIEQHFQHVRGTSLFLLSPLDWALIETWKNAGIPLQAVLRGIDAAFAKWHSRKSRMQQVNSLAYCAQAVLEEARIMAGAAPEKPPKEAPAPFSAAELAAYLEENARQLSDTGRGAFQDLAAALLKFAAESAQHLQNLGELEQRLTALEDKIIAIARGEQTDQDLFEARRELDSYLRPYRSKMTAAQLTMLEIQFLDRRLFEKMRLPRLSLFYMH